ncbi:hypothetical protein [Streptomyces sp. NPDC047453]|uniref:hypothetical protein n=1 Tax=Streptomyces sp. NPDC047453 TaxID=3154812 RepID=UPI0033EEDABB
MGPAASASSAFDWTKSATTSGHAEQRLGHGHGTVRNALKAGAPHLRPVLHEGTTQDQRRMLQRGLIDIGLLHNEVPELPSSRVFSHSFGCAIRNTLKVSLDGPVTFRDLDGLRVMAHSENPDEEMRLRAVAAAGKVSIDWLFRRFSEHAALNEGIDTCRNNLKDDATVVVLNWHGPAGHDRRNAVRGPDRG